MFKEHRVLSYHKQFNTLWSLLVRPKDKTEKEKQCGVVYSVTCNKCYVEYVGEMARLLGMQFKQHTDGKHMSSAVMVHMYNTGHKYSMEDVKVLSSESKNFHRNTLEAISIHK